MLNTSLYDNSTSTGGRVRPLWYNYPECVVSPQPFAFYFACKLINLVVGTPGNIFVIWQIASKKKNTSTSDIFFFNLAVLDAYFCLMTPIELANRLDLVMAPLAFACIASMSGTGQGLNMALGAVCLVSVSVRQSQSFVLNQLPKKQIVGYEQSASRIQKNNRFSGSL